jgi:hypothetical protein
MTFKQTLYEDWCMDNGGLIKQGVYDNCVFKKSPTINKKKVRRSYGYQYGNRYRGNNF